MNFFTIEHLSQTLGKKQILTDISMHTSEGTITALLGPNGAGKTTLLKTIIGLHPNPPANTLQERNIILFQNTLLNQLAVYKRIELGLAYLPQQTSLFQHMTVADNLHLVYEHHPSWNKQSQGKFIETRNRWLEKTQLSSTLKQQAETLSGGQKRKLEVVRALLMSPKGIMLDEPFAGVDPKSIYELKSIFMEIAQSDIAIIISDHHVDQLLSIAQKVYVMLNGQVICHGTIQEILENNLTKERYLGNQFYEEMSQRFLTRHVV